ncbi:MAG: nucleoside 2-deoxyribosyltransferase [Syntrophobacter sp.]
MKENELKIYFAGPLFSEAERDWIRGVKRQIEEVANARGADIALIWPYELITREELEALGDSAKYEIHSRCRSHLENADLLIAVLDGTQVDDGTAWEIGYYYGLRRDHSRIIGVRTDFRNAGEAKNSIVNAMIECSCSSIARSTAELLATITARIFGVPL